MHRPVTRFVFVGLTGGSSGESSTGVTTDLPSEPEGDCR